MTDYEGRSRVPRYDPGVPATGIAAILVTVIAAGAGFLVLRNVNDNADSITSLGNGSAAAVAGHSDSMVMPDTSTDTGATAGVTDGTTAPLTPATVAPAATFTGTSVIVANANSVGGSAGDATDLLKTATDFELGDPTNATEAVGQLETSVVYYDTANAAAQPVANTLARVLGGLNVAPLPAESPITGDRGDAGVVLMLGEDLAEVALTDLVQPLKAGPVTPATVASTTDTTAPS